MRGNYFDYTSKKLMGGVVEENMRSKMFIKNDSLVHESKRKVHSYSSTNISDNETTIYDSNGKIKFTKQYTDVMGKFKNQNGLRKPKG